MDLINASTTDKSEVVKSKCFTGIVSNVGIINHGLNIPKEIMNFIIKSQTLFNDDWLKSTDITEDDAADSPISKKKKIT